jgi:hypothetical protein
MKYVGAAILVSSLCCGCSLVSNGGHKPAWGTQADTPTVYLDMFLDSVNRDVAREAHGDRMVGGWAKYWVSRCEDVYSSKEGEISVRYISDRRRAAGLPDIPEIEKRQFRSPWQMFTDHVDEQLARERQGLPPPRFHPGGRESPHPTWREYWIYIERAASPNRDAFVSDEGVGYIRDRRVAMGLPPL